MTRESRTHDRKIRLLAGALAISALASLSLASASGQSQPKGTSGTAADGPALYERLGGVYNIATVVDDFIERLLVNDALNANPRILEARNRVPKAGLKYHVTALVCQVTGGPCTYGGRTMKESHAHLNINETQWQAMVGDFKKTLAKFRVPAREQEELIAIVESTKKDIVVAGRPHE